MYIWTPNIKQFLVVKRLGHVFRYVELRPINKSDVSNLSIMPITKTYGITGYDLVDLVKYKQIKVLINRPLNRQFSKVFREITPIILHQSARSFAKELNKISHYLFSKGVRIMQTRRAIRANTVYKSESLVVVDMLSLLHTLISDENLIVSYDSLTNSFTLKNQRLKRCAEIRGYRAVRLNPVKWLVYKGEPNVVMET